MKTTEKGKAIIDVEKLEENNIQTQPRRPKTRAMDRKENHVEDPYPPQAQDTIDDTITTEFQKDKEY